MLDALGFDNYRIFDKETILNLKPITILTGPNSSGKSSIIKAAKLLKQNTSEEKYSGIPVQLNFIPDTEGHYLGDFDRIVSMKNKSKKENIDFIIPINLSTLGENYFCKLEYGPVKNKQITLLSYTLYKNQNGKRHELVILKGGMGEFYEMFIDPAHFKNCLENTFIPHLRDLDHKIPLNDYQNIINAQKKANLPGKHMIKSLLKSYKKYDINKPLLPYYQLIKGNLASNIDIGDYEEVVEEYFGIMDKIEDTKQYFQDRINDKQCTVESYFKRIEKDLFSLIKRKNLFFPIDLDVNEKSIEFSWKGIIPYNFISEDIMTSEVTSKAILEFNPSYTFLMECFGPPYGAPYDDESIVNTNIFYDYIKYIIIESMEQCRASINNFNFFDSNRIEQELFYHHSNSRIGYNLINDFMKQAHSQNYEEIKVFLRKIKIADSFEIKPLDFGIYTINLVRDNHVFPLSHFGFGISKLFFLLLALQTYKMIFIEEPESNLHPDFQSKLADFIADVQKGRNIQLIIETHSEYFIRKLQYLVATKEIEEDKILINYFNPESVRKKEGIVKEIMIRNNGILTQGFGPGFFDEADNLAMQLFIMSSNSKN
jgi:AAA15 family ATPase/GTPase